MMQLVKRWQVTAVYFRSRIADMAVSRRIAFATASISIVFCLTAIPSLAFAEPGCPQPASATKDIGIVSDNPHSACDLYNGISYCQDISFSQYGPFSATYTFPLAPSPGCTTEPQGNLTVTFTGDFAVTGYAFQKYVILGVDYAPPGMKSTVTYTNTNIQGSSTSFTNSTSDKLTVTETLSANADGAFFSAKGGGSASTSYTQEADTSSMVSITRSAASTDTVPGPASSGVGIDHDFDRIWVWLNPGVQLTLIDPQNIQWGGYVYNPADIDSNGNPVGMEVVALYVEWLKDPSTIDANVVPRLARSWDKQTQNPGLTSDDFTAILHANPFYDPSYNPYSDTSGRFDLLSTQTIDYYGPASGGQPGAQGYMFTTTSTSAAGQGAKYTYSTAVTIDTGASASFIVGFNGDLKISNTWTWTNGWSTTNTSSTGTTVNASITPPATSDNYCGPPEMQLWRDNIWGSFMFYPIGVSTCTTTSPPPGNVNIVPIIAPLLLHGSSSTQ